MKTTKNYWIKKKDEKGNIIWRSGRAQGLDGAKKRIGDIKQDIRSILKRKRKIRILEIGCGFGRALLELKRIFGKKVEVIGTNYESNWNQKLTNEYAFHQGFSKEEIPKIYILDAGKKLPFKKESFDFVFCQATMQYIINRALFIEESNRILTKEGLAVLELQEFRDDHPEKYKELIEISQGNRKVDVLKYLKKFRNISIKKSKGKWWHYIIMKKANNFDLKLKLIKSINLEAISSKFWGKKVIYEVR